MKDKDFTELFVHFMRFYEDSGLDTVTEDKLRLENSDDIISDFIEMFNESLAYKQNYRASWLMFRYGAPDNFKLLIEWLNFGLATSNSLVKLDNLAQSQENVITFLLEKGLINHSQIRDLIKKLKRREIGGYSDRPRKLLEFHLTEFENNNEKENQTKGKDLELFNDLKKYHARHYALSYLLECIALGKTPPLGKKSSLEKIGIERIGDKKGNRFYKAINEISNLDLNVESNLITIGGEELKLTVLQLSKHPKEIEEYLQTKGL